MTKGVPPQAGSGHSPKGGAASCTASPAQPSVPNADARLAELLALKEDWNSYRGQPIDRAVAERVRAFFPLAAKLELSPWISPLSDGSLQIERSGTDDYTVEFNRDGTATISLDGLSDQDAFGLLSQFALLQALNRAASGMPPSENNADCSRPKAGSPTAESGDAQPLEPKD